MTRDESLLAWLDQIEAAAERLAAECHAVAIQVRQIKRERQRPAKKGAQG